MAPVEHPLGPTGAGAHVVLVHGVGLDGTLFGPVAERLVATGTGATVVARRGYDDRYATADLGRHVDDLATAVAEAPGTGPVVVAGVSGGATLALALAVGGTPRLAAAIAHEPLVGPLAPTQHDVISHSIDTLLHDDGPDAVEAFLERLVTPPTWAALDPDVRAAAVARAATVRTEAAGFATFAVGGADLAAAAVPITWTVGAGSPPWRHDAATIGAAHGVQVVPVDCVHTPQVEDPDGFVAVVDHTIGALV